MSLATYSDRQSSLLPPRGLLLSLLGQVPLIIGNWPLKPSMFAGLVVIAAGIALNIWAARLFERDSIGICPFSSTPVLVTRGPFVVTRHPMYLGLVAIALGLSLATGVLANMWSAVTLAVWLHYAYVLPEEKFLRDHFDTAYDEYSKRVSRWVRVGK